MKYLGLIAFILFSANSIAWDGYDANTGNSVEIGSGNLVRSGETIEIYDYEDGQYKDVDVESITSYGSSVEVEVYDHDSGEYRTLEMDQD